jgi:hypothetical protein
VYFEEWDDPMISGIAWVSELIGIAGGDDIFPELAGEKSARNRIVTVDQVIRRSPDVIIGSWCGKKFRPEKVAARPGFDVVPAVRNGRVYEIKSPLILQPGPAALTDGLAALRRIIGDSISARSEKLTLACRELYVGAGNGPVARGPLRGREVGHGKRPQHRAVVRGHLLDTHIRRRLHWWRPWHHHCRITVMLAARNAEYRLIKCPGCPGHIVLRAG